MYQRLRWVLRGEIRQRQCLGVAPTFIRFLTLF
nr:MAG TPA: hypothetical protein [Caudoviricetes sp.]